MCSTRARGIPPIGTSTPTESAWRCASRRSPSTSRIFLAEAERGRQLLASGDADRGLGLLRRAESRYLGDFLEDNPYAEWAVALREEARAVYLSISEQLALADRDAGAYDEAARRCLRMIERDPYLEQAYLDAINAMTALGRHGSARRLYGIYSSRMGELDIEPAPFPSGS